MKIVKWKVICLTTPTIIRHCKKCHKDAEFICSDMFRVNAQKKTLDIWLIYNCSQCKTSWNATIFSRVNSSKIDAKTLNLFLNNDQGLVKKYSLDKTTLKKNGVYINKLDYEVVGENFSSVEPVQLEISCELPLDIKLSTIIKTKLDLSNLEFKALFAGPSRNNVRKKINTKIVVFFNLKAYEERTKEVFS